MLPKFRTYDFLDTSDFNGCIIDTKIEHIDELENHVRLIMIHFSSYRKLEDLQKEGSYLKKFQNNKILQFIQDIRNNYCVLLQKDELSKNTTKYYDPNENNKSKVDDESDAENNEEYDVDALNACYQYLSQDISSLQNIDLSISNIPDEKMPRNLNLSNLRNKSNNTTKISNLTIEENSDHFLEFELKDENQISKKDGDIEVQMSLVTQKKTDRTSFFKESKGDSKFQ